MKKTWLMFLLFGIFAFFVGCGSSRIMILQSSAGNVGRIGTLQINEVQSEIPTVPRYILARIREILVERLRSSDAFSKITTNGEGSITVDIKVTDFEEGDQVTRWLWTGIGGWGEGRIELETTYSINDGREEIARVKAQGTVNTGLLGGSMDSAFSRAVSEIADYTIKEFGL